MAKGIGENPVKSPAYVATLVEYPATRDELVQAAADSEAPVEVINFFKSLPAERYGSYEELLRDFAEAERRFADFTAKDRGPGRADLGRAATENGRGPVRHP
jgi:hypothetical protein